MKQCMELEVKHMIRGSAFPLFECGGAYVKAGDKILVTPNHGKAIIGRYRGIIRVINSSVAVERLAGGHYQINTPNGQVNSVKMDAVGDAAFKSKKEMVAPPADKSMTDRAKTRIKKRKPTNHDG